MRFSTLDEWLAWQETLHPSEIDLGLERVEQVFRSLHADMPPFVVFTVAGTNGKGSSVALLDAILRAAGYRVGIYTSPHLLRYNERIRLDGKPVEDSALLEAFDRIDRARGDISLTYFEFGTLAALDLFYRAQPDVVILEVGMGGRLDAVNIIDPDVALITSISIDHVKWLGNDREQIAREKAGIMRAERPAVFSGMNMPVAIERHAQEIGASLTRAGADFHYAVGETGWQWQTGILPPVSLPLPALRGEHQLQNAAGVLEVLHRYSDRLPIPRQAIRNGLLTVQLAGRFQQVPGDISWVLDVAHNPAGIHQLVTLLQSSTGEGRTLAVFGMLEDKDSASVARLLQPCVDVWFLTPLPTSRSLNGKDLADTLAQVDETSELHICTDVAAACDAARAEARPGDRILVCGSFYTVAGALAHGI
jgi:dihydrofolate synthase/folylpolyglutamate synthase